MRKALIALGVIVVVLVVADRVAKVVAERQAETRIQQRYDLAARPDVTVHGFPFLTQLLDRELDRVDLTAEDTTVGALDGLDIEVTARTIHLVSTDEGRAAFVSGKVILPYGSLVDVARDAGAPAIDLKYGGAPETVEISARIDLPTGDIDVVAYSTVHLGGSRITVRMDRVEVKGASAPPAGLDLALGDRLDFDIDLPDVPGIGEITVDTVEARAEGILLVVTGRDVAVG